MKNTGNPAPPMAEAVFGALFIFIALFRGGSLLSDGDTGYHIRAGEYIISNLSVPRFDMFSFHDPALRWTAHEWLSEVLMALVHGRSGLTGVVVMYAFVIALTSYLLFRKIQGDRGDFLVAVAVIIIAICSSGIHWLARPHVFTLLFAIVWYQLLDSYHTDGRSRLYLMPPLMVLWANLHGGYILGVMLIGIYALGNVAGYFTSEAHKRRVFRQRAQGLALALVACLLAAAINPYGFDILLFPFRLTSNRFLMDNVVEFLSPNFHNFLMFKYMLLLLMAVLAVSRKRLAFIEVVMVLLFTSMALYSQRHITLFAMFTAPILARHASLIISGLDGRLAALFRKRSEGFAGLDASSVRYAWAAAAVVIVVAVAASGRVEYGFDETKHPVKAVEFLKAERLPGNMFNDDEFGDYIIYAAWPEYKVFFDGRSDMYGSDMIREYVRLRGIQPGWDGVLEKYGINWIIYRKGSTLSEFLGQRSDWRRIYTDELAVIYLKNTPGNAGLIEKYKDMWQ